jgi:hypothetical protein
MISEQSGGKLRDRGTALLWSNRALRNHRADVPT